MQGNPWRTGLFAALAAAILAQPCSAGYIRLDARPSAQAVERFFSVSAAITNAGTEPAYKVEVSVEAEGRSVKLPPIDRIGTDEQRTIRARLPVGPLSPGTYTAILRIHYTDVNGYPFSTVMAMPVSKWVNPPSPLASVVTGGEVTASGEVRVRVHNPARHPLPSVHVRIAAPAELSVTPSEARLALESGQEEELRFAVRNGSALPGSSYAVVAILDADVQGLHTSMSRAAHLSILAPPGTPSPGWMVAGLAATPIVVLLLRRLSQRAAARFTKPPDLRITVRRASG